MLGKSEKRNPAFKRGFVWSAIAVILPSLSFLRNSYSCQNLLVQRGTIFTS